MGEAYHVERLRQDGSNSLCSQRSPRPTQAGIRAYRARAPRRAVARRGRAVGEILTEVRYPRFCDCGRKAGRSNLPSELGLCRRCARVLRRAAARASLRAQRKRDTWLWAVDALRGRAIPAAIESLESAIVDPFEPRRDLPAGRAITQLRAAARLQFPWDRLGERSQEFARVAIVSRSSPAQARAARAERLAVLLSTASIEAIERWRAARGTTTLDSIAELWAREASK